MRHALRAPQDLDLTAIDPRGRPVGPRDKESAAAAMTELEERLDPLQEALYAEAAGGGRRAVLLVLQGMDTSGKGGVIEHAAGVMNPQGLQIASFKKPTAEELAHDFLWRIRKQVPAPGHDRRLRPLALRGRAGGAGERAGPGAGVARRGTPRSATSRPSSPRAASRSSSACCTSRREEQQERLLARLDDPAKRWKYNPGDVDVRARWHDYRAAYTDAVAADRHRRRALVRRPVGPQVVPQLGGVRAARRDAARSWPRSSRRRRTTWPSSGGGWRPVCDQRDQRVDQPEGERRHERRHRDGQHPRARRCCPPTPQRTADSRFVAPTPRIDDVIVCVVEIGAANANAVV